MDEIDLIPLRRIDRGSTSSIKSLAQRSGLFFRLTQGYVFLMLRYKDLLLAKLVEREFLSVGNPETNFEYGALQRGQRIKVVSDAELFRSSSVYLTIYNRSSFPIRWCQIDEPIFLGAAVDEDATYLVRCHRRSGSVDRGRRPSVLVVDG